MSAIPTERDNPKGLHQRYIVRKANGDPVDHLATYFVLRLDGHGDDGAHIQASREAALAYCRFARDVPHLARMAEELKTLVTNLEQMGG
jgi:hypothetical protein